MMHLKNSSVSRNFKLTLQSLLDFSPLSSNFSFIPSSFQFAIAPHTGEFAFVALGIAERSGLIAPELCKLLLTTVALSMAATPILAEAGGYIAKKIEDERGECVCVCVRDG